MWSADWADIDLTRHRGGGMDGRVALALTLGDQKAGLTGNFHLAPSARSVHVEAALSALTPKALAEAAPALAPLAALDVPISVSGEADLGPEIKAQFGGAYIANEGYTPEAAAQAIGAGSADAVAFAKLFLANPDLPRRIREGAPFNELHPQTMYGPGPEGYTDYPNLS